MIVPLSGKMSNGIFNQRHQIFKSDKNIYKYFNFYCSSHLSLNKTRILGFNEQIIVTCALIVSAIPGHLVKGEKSLILCMGFPRLGNISKCSKGHKTGLCLIPLEISSTPIKSERIVSRGEGNFSIKRPRLSLRAL